MTKDIKKPTVNSNLPPINERIPGTKVQLINSTGENVGVVSKFDAIREAQLDGLDLVMLSDMGSEGVPVAKIMDLGKAVYAKKKKTAEAKKKQKVIKVKEVKIRPSIGEHDLLTKVKQSAAFLKEGMRIKFTLVYKGREMTLRNDSGPNLFTKFENLLAEAGVEHLQAEGESRSGLFWSKIYYLKS